MKKLASFLMPLLMLPVTGTFSQIACAVPNYDIHRYEDISFTGYIKCDLKKFDDRDEFYRLSLTDNSGQITVVDSIADSDKNKDSYEKILQICPAGSRCTITGDLETREQQQFINFINIKNIVKETEYHIPAGAVSEIDTGINYNHVKLYENVELTGYIKCTIEHFGTPSDYYILSLEDSTQQIDIAANVQNEFEGSKNLYKRILGICPEGSRCTLIGDFQDYNGGYREFVRIKKIVKD